jgi:peptidoglycan/LPS O-acetylase OafA/YrhL
MMDEQPARAAGERATILDDVAYWLAIASVYFLVGVLFFYSGKEKLFDNDAHAPAAIKQQFEGTFVATFPGVDALWAILSVLEFAVFVILVVSLLRGEFLPHRRKLILLVGLALALFTFACLSFGQTSTGNNEGTASLYTYFGATAIVILLVLMLPPNRPRAWLSGLGR